MIGPLDVRCRRGVEPDVLRQAGIAHISPSATRTSLTKGGTQGGHTVVLPCRSWRLHPGPDGREVHDQQAEGRRRSSSIDFQEPYSQGLSDAVDDVLKAKGVSTSAVGLHTSMTDFSSFVTKVPSGRGRRLLPARRSRRRADLRAAAGRAGQEGEVCSAATARTTRVQFKMPGAYVSNFAPRHLGNPVRQGDHRGLEEGQPGRDARLVRSSDLPRSPGRAERGQAGVRCRQGQDRGSQGSRPAGEEDRRSELDPRRSRSASRRSRTTR